MSDLYDVVVVGGGAAGLSGALVLAQGKCRVLVIDGGQPRNRFDAHMHGYLSRDGMKPSELLEEGRREVRHFGGEIRTGHVAAAHAEGEPGSPRFRLVLDDGDEVRGKRLLIATGITDRLPEVDGIEEFWGGAVFHCPYCHGAEIEPDTVVGVVGCGPESVAKAHLLLQWANRVVLLLNDQVDLDEDEGRALEMRGIDVVPGRVEAVRVEDGVITGAKAGGEVVELDELLIAPIAEPNHDLLVMLGVAPASSPDDLGATLECDASGCTAVEGVWAAGNVRDSNAQVINAAGQGVRAAIAINASLVEEKVVEALAAA